MYYSMTLYNKLRGYFLSLFTEKLSAPQSAAELQSQTIMWLRFPLALLVLLIHVNPENREIFTPIQTVKQGNIYTYPDCRYFTFNNSEHL